MIAPTHLSLAGPLCRAQSVLQGSLQNLAFGRRGRFDLMSVDLRLALVTPVARSLRQAADAVTGHVMGRALEGARFAQGITAAATMVAAARH